MSFATRLRAKMPWWLKRSWSEFLFWHLDDLEWHSTNGRYLNYAVYLTRRASAWFVFYWNVSILLDTGTRKQNSKVEVNKASSWCAAVSSTRWEILSISSRIKCQCNHAYQTVHAFHLWYLANLYNMDERPKNKTNLPGENCSGSPLADLLIAWR